MPYHEGKSNPGSAPLDWSADETARLTVLASEFAGLRDRQTTTPADELRMRNIADELKASIAEKERTRSDAGLDLREAERIMGRDFLGSDAFEKAFGFKPDQVPAFPYSAVELEACKQLNEQVVLRLAVDADGKPMDLPRFQALFKAKTGKKLTESDWNPAKQPFAAETPNFEWKRVSKDVLPGSKNKNYFDQTIILYDHLVKAGTLPQDANERARLVSDVATIRAFYDQDQNKNWKHAVDQLVALPINATYRRKSVETLSDLGLRYGSTGEYQLQGVYDWGNSRNAGGGLMLVGDFASQGADVRSSRPGLAHDNLGVCSSR